MEHLRDQWRSVTAGVKPLSGDVKRLGTREQWRKIGSLEIDRRDGLTLYTDANRYGPHQRWWVEGWLGGRIVDVAELVVKPGRVMFEIGGIPEDVAREALRLAGHKLPIKTKFISKEEAGGEADEG